MIALASPHHRRETEYLFGEDAEPFRHVEVAVSNTHAYALGMQAAISHEVPDEFSQFRGEDVRHP